MANFIGLISNCLARGNQTIEVGGETITRTFSFSVDGFEITLLPHPEIAELQNTSSVSGKNLVTSRLLIRDVEPANLPGILECIPLVCELLSFALTSRIGFCGYDCAVVNPAQVRYSTLGSIQSFRPPFSWMNGNSIKVFLETCYDNYKALRTPRLLNIATDLLNHAELPMAIEVHLTVLSVVLENLKHTFALHDGYPFIEGGFREKHIVAAPLGRPISFRRLLTEMLGVHGMTPALGPIKDLRNEIIHTGFSALSFQQKWAKQEEITTIIREYILRLVGYHGAFFPYDTNGPRIIP